MWSNDLHVIFFFNDTATTEIYTLSLHDALPICHRPRLFGARVHVDVRVVGADREDGEIDRRRAVAERAEGARVGRVADRKSTRLNSSHANISYAVFCLKKKKNSNYCACATHTTR